MNVITHISSWVLARVSLPSRVRGADMSNEHPPGNLVTLTPDIEDSFLVVVLARLDNDHRVRKVLLVIVIVQIEIVV